VVLPSQYGEDMKGNGLRPERILTWLSLLGITCYVITWIGYDTFYRSFSVSPEAVGISYPALLIPAAVFFSLILMLVAGIAALAAPLFMRVPIGAAGVLSQVGLLIFALSIFWAGMKPPPHTGLPPSSLLLALAMLFGGILFSHGVGIMISHKVDKYWRRLRHLSRVRRLRRRIQPECSVGEKRAVIRKYVATRRRRRRNWARLRKDFREAVPVTFALLFAAAAFLTLSFIVYLSHSAEQAARDVAAGKQMFNSGGDFPAAVLLNVRARKVEVLAVESRFRSLEREKLLYLGTKDGAYVVYDIAQKKALLIPSGAIALQFSQEST
jgi:hypothetical protein